MRTLFRLALLATIVMLLASCRPPTNWQGHPDSRNPGPFWQREQQRD